MAPAAPVTATEIGDLLIVQSLNAVLSLLRGKRKLARLFPLLNRNRNSNHDLSRIVINRFLELGSETCWNGLKFLTVARAKIIGPATLHAA
jgi:hypothetical protein